MFASYSTCQCARSFDFALIAVADVSSYRAHCGADHPLVVGVFNLASHISLETHYVVVEIIILVHTQIVHTQ